MIDHFVCEIAELEPGEVRIAKCGLVEVGVIRQGNDFYAYRNLCPHQGGPACEGMRIPQVCDIVDERGFFHGQRFDESDMHIVCPWHGYEYHLETGRHVVDARIRLQKFEVETRDGGIYVRV